MTLIIGIITVIGCVLGGYVLHHGNIGVLYQPTEYLIIAGAAIGAFIISNPPHILKAVLKSFKYLMKPAPFVKADYIELLLFLYNIFKFIKQKGLLQIESHLEKPEESEFFKAYPTFMHHDHAVTFFCDYMRLMTMGVDDKHKLEDLMDAELDAHHHEKELIASSVVNLGDSFPAIGIVAAVLGVIITMGSISEPPEILGQLIGGALVGTFLGILLSYGFVSPMGNYLGKFFNMEHSYYMCIKAAMLANAQGMAPAVSIEFARKVIPGDFMPTFKDVEAALQAGGGS